MTYREAIKAGYKKADIKYTVGYVSRKANLENQEVFTASGSRKGELYILVPCFHSSRFCFRQYLTK